MTKFLKDIEQPLVSIVIPVYNGSNYMREAIDSALAQTYTNIEIIVVNDGSNDNGATEEIALSYGDKIRYFSKENGGVATALNMGIERMHGEYFSWLSHDDLYLPEKIQKQIDVLRLHGKPAIASCDFAMFFQDRKDKVPWIMSENAIASVRCLLAIDTKNTLHGCGLLVPRSAFEQYGLFNPDLRTTQDYDLWFRFADGYPFIHIREILVLSRQHAEQHGKAQGDLCSQESDILHSHMVGNLHPHEIDCFFNEPFKELHAQYTIYKNAGFLKTAARLLKHLVRLTLELDTENDTILLVNDEIFCFDNLGRTKEQWHSITSWLSVPSGKKRLLLYTNYWIRGGLERVLASVANHLSKDYEVVLVSFFSGDEAVFFLSERVLHITISDTADERYFKFRISALAVLLNVDLFIGNSNFFVPLLETYPLIHGLGIRTIACNHGHYFLPYSRPWLYPVVAKREIAYDYSDIVTWSTSFSSHADAQFRSHVATLPNPATFPPAAPKLMTTSKNILFVARFDDDIKRVDRALEVFSRVLEQHPDAELFLVGRYNLDMPNPGNRSETVAQLIDRLNFPPGVLHLEGEQKDIIPYYQMADLLILTSDSEGFAVVLTEAGAYSLPCVLFEIPGLDDIITDGVNGYIVAQDDLDGMAQKIIFLLANPALRVQMGKNARSMVKRFDKSIICDRWSNLIKLALSKNEDEKSFLTSLAFFLQPVPNREAFIRQLADSYTSACQLLPPEHLLQFEKLGINISLVLEGQKTALKASIPSLFSKLWVSMRKNGFRSTLKKIFHKLNVPR